MGNPRLLADRRVPGAQTPCNPATNTYSQQIILIYDDAPEGLIHVNGSLFTVTGSPQTVSLNNLLPTATGGCDGLLHR